MAESSGNETRRGAGECKVRSDAEMKREGKPICEARRSRQDMRDTGNGCSDEVAAAANIGGMRREDARPVFVT